MNNSIIEAIILTGPAAGEVAYIPRILMIPTDYPFSFKRLHFPIKMSFAITINKSQGQTFSCVGVDLSRECFSHGQQHFHVAEDQKNYIYWWQEIKQETLYIEKYFKI